MKKHPFLFAVLVSVLSLLMGIAVIGCPAGTKTSVEAGVSAVVSPTQCQEVKGDAGELPGQTVALDCANITGSGTIRIVFPRAAWWSIKQSASDAGFDTGPGK